MGKGSKRRPSQVPQGEHTRRWEETFGKLEEPEVSFEIAQTAEGILEIYDPFTGEGHPLDLATFKGKKI
jgi:hypothetical protein